MAVRPYAIPQGEAGEGLRDYMPASTAARRRPRARWPWLVLIAFLLGVATGAKAFAAEPAVRFIQPRTPFVLAGLTGTLIPVQIRIEPDAANRAYAITWCDGASSRSLDGADAAPIQPEEKPLEVRVGPGDCEFVASVLGAGGALRARTSFVMHICGGPDDPCVRGDR
jgi:hypothetical protein